MDHKNNSENPPSRTTSYHRRPGPETGSYRVFQSWSYRRVAQLKKMTSLYLWRKTVKTVTVEITKICLDLSNSLLPIRLQNKMITNSNCFIPMTSQKVPPYPLAHWHVTPDTFSTHVPPFKQGFVLHPKILQWNNVSNCFYH